MTDGMGPPPTPARLPTAAHGTRMEAYGPVEWGLFGAVALMWGSSFFFIEVALRGLHPGVVSWLRLLLSVLTFAAIRQARAPISRTDLPRVVLLGVLWLAVPILAFPAAQQWVDSSMAGILNSVSPLVTAFIAAVLLRRMPPVWQVLGFVLGLGGLVLLSAPSLRHADATALGILIIVLAVVAYGLGATLAVPIQQRYGSFPLLFRAQIVALVAVTPFGLYGLSASTLRLDSMLAVIPLGVFGSSLAFLAMATLAGRVGAPRAAITLYAVPVVAVALGVLALQETLPPRALGGGLLVIVGAWLVSRAEHRPAGANPEPENSPRCRYDP